MFGEVIIAMHISCGLVSDSICLNISQIGFLDLGSASLDITCTDYCIVLQH